MGFDTPLESNIVPLKESSASLFRPDPWMLCETGFDISDNYQAETLFALGNGTIGLRGTHEEKYLGPSGSTHEGNYLNGFYESEPIDYPESAYGLAQNNQFMLNLPNAKRIELDVGGEPFNLMLGKIHSYERRLDFRTGILERKVHWESPQGKQIIITSERIVCFQRRHVFATRYQITALNFNGQLSLSSAIDMEFTSPIVTDDPRVSAQSSSLCLQFQHSEINPEYAALELRTKVSGFNVISAMSNEAIGWVADSAQTSTPEQTDDSLGIVQNFTGNIGIGETRCLVKYGCYASSRDYPAELLNTHGKFILHQARLSGFDELCREQKQYLAEFWNRSDIEIEGDAALQQGMHFNQFHLLQSVGRDGITNIAAKGLTGEGYEGHYFWDTEIYVLPFFLYSKPEIARQLLLYRFNGLDKARERARQMSHKTGALYPWRTIAGEECSAYFPAGTAQYHINADIAYAVQQYVEVTDDTEFLIRHGAEMVLETARIWMDLGHFSSDGRFCINEVTGPDEYTALVNNNYYTNAMAQQHLQFALSISARLSAEFPEEHLRLVDALGLTEHELDDWARAADHMYLPYDAQLDIHAQDDSFLLKKVWDFEGTPKENYPLLLHYHPLVIYRHQVCKQADLMLAMMLLSDKFTWPEKKNNFDYYEKITTHDSSLSSCIFSIIASEIGYHDKAYAYFMETVRMDLDDTHRNTCHGVHTAAMAGSWMCVTYGFAGMRVIEGLARFNPMLPKQWNHYQFRIQLHGALLEVRVESAQTSYRLLDGEALNLRHSDQEFQLTVQAPLSVHVNQSTL